MTLKRRLNRDTISTLDKYVIPLTSFCFHIAKYTYNLTSKLRQLGQWIEYDV